MTTDADPGFKLRALLLVVVLVFGVTVTGGYVTTAVLTDSETVELSFHLVGNAGNAGNVNGNTGTGTAGGSAETSTTTNAVAEPAEVGPPSLIADRAVAAAPTRATGRFPGTDTAAADWGPAPTVASQSGAGG